MPIVEPVTGSTIPEALYKAVAAVLAFVLRKKQARSEA